MLITGKAAPVRVTEIGLAARWITLMRPARKDEAARDGGRLLKIVRHLIESVYDTINGQLDLEAHGGPTPRGMIRDLPSGIVCQRSGVMIGRRPPR